jgi:hypothetical protein
MLCSVVKVQRGGPAPLTLASLGAAGASLSAAHSARRHRIERVSIAADAPVVRITAALQVATRSGEGMCGAAVSREPLNDPAQERATPVRTNSAARRRHHLQRVVLVRRWGWLSGA